MSTQTKSPPFVIIPNREVFLSLSQESQAKVEALYKVAVIAHNYGLQPMETDDFDYLYDKSVVELENYARNLEPHLRFEQMIAEIRGNRSA